MASFYHFFFKRRGNPETTILAYHEALNIYFKRFVYVDWPQFSLGEHVVFNEEILNYLVSLSRITHKNVQHFCFSIITFIIFSFSMLEKKVDLIVYTHRTPLILGRIM